MKRGTGTTTGTTDALTTERKKRGEEVEEEEVGAKMTGRTRSQD